MSRGRPPKPEGEKRKAPMDELELERTTEKVLELHTRRYTCRQIADQLKLPKTTVNDILRKATAHYKRTNKAFINEIVHGALASLDHVENQAWQGWDKSLEMGGKTKEESMKLSVDPKVKKIDKAVDKQLEQGLSQDDRRTLGMIKVITERYEQCGDPRFLAIIVRSALAKAKLLDSLNLKQSQSDALEKMLELMLGYGAKDPSDIPTEQTKEESEQSE